MKIQKVGTNEVYDEAIDPAEFDRQYVETDEPIEAEPEDEESTQI